MLEDQGTEVFLSPVSSLELARLAWGGRISIEGRVQTWVQNATRFAGKDGRFHTRDRRRVLRTAW
jgi:PIN domain nuclease of toxin-antitoxin system